MRQIKRIRVFFRAHVKIASRIVSQICCRSSICRILVVDLCEKDKLKSKRRISSEVSVNSLRGIRGVSPEEEKEGYGGKDLQRGTF